MQPADASQHPAQPVDDPAAALTPESDRLGTHGDGDDVEYYDCDDGGPGSSDDPDNAAAAPAAVAAAADPLDGIRPALQATYWQQYLPILLHQRDQLLMEGRSCSLSCSSTAVAPCSEAHVDNSSGPCHTTHGRQHCPEVHEQQPVAHAQPHHSLSAAEQRSHAPPGPGSLPHSSGSPAVEAHSSAATDAAADDTLGPMLGSSSNASCSDRSFKVFHCSACSSLRWHERLLCPGGTQVWVYTQRGVHSVTLPVVTCLTCHQQQKVTPLHLACMPGTPAAWSAAPGSAWFCMLLLRHLDQSTDEQRRLATNSYVDTQYSMWEYSMQLMAIPPAAAVRLHQLPAGMALAQVPLSKDSMRRQLSAAAREMQFLLTRAATLPEQLPGWGTGPRHPCAACLPGRMHLSVDGCCKLQWFKRSGYSLDYKQPDNTRLFVGNAEHTSRIQQVDAELEQHLTPAAQQLRSSVLSASPAQLPADLAAVAAAAVAAGGNADVADGAGAQGGAGSNARARKRARRGTVADGRSGGAGGSSSSSSSMPAEAECSAFQADQVTAPSTKSQVIGQFYSRGRLYHMAATTSSSWWGHWCHCHRLTADHPVDLAWGAVPMACCAPCLVLYSATEACVGALPCCSG
jgi:hypothetical protein